ncbi:MAG: hypothetical protein MJ231_06105 [bacterium]|nr:hypothetical protein [bacterium]
MTFLDILKEPAILIITTFFLFFTLTVLRNYTRIETNLKSVYNYLHTLNKKEISYRFNELDNYMSSNTYTNTIWDDFKKALMFPDKLYTASQNSKNMGNQVPEIYSTSDASYFFNEETLVHSRINHKFIQVMPTILTGLGPFFTFLKMAIAFTTVDFTSSEVDKSLNSLIANIQVAALCSVFAVGYSLLFLFVEKILYNRKCKKYYLLIQKEFIRLFDVCTSEQFLMDLVNEAKNQNSSSEKILKSLPEDFAKAVSKSIGEITTPYLENSLYSLHKLNENLDNGGNGGDVVDKLF